MWLFEYLKKVGNEILLLDSREKLPKKAGKIIIGILILYCIPLLIEYGVIKVLDDMGKTANITAYVTAYERDPDGYFVPLVISNIGEKDLFLKKIVVNTCYNTSPLVYHPNVPLERMGGKYQLPLKSKELLSHIFKKQCYEELNVTSQEEGFSPYIVNKTMMMLPPTNFSFYACGLCEISVEIETDLKNSTVKSQIYAAKEIPVTAYSYNYNSRIVLDEKRKMSPVSITIFTPKEECEYYHSCEQISGAYEPTTEDMSLDNCLEINLSPNRSTPDLAELADLRVCIRRR